MFSSLIMEFVRLMTCQSADKFTNLNSIQKFTKITYFTKIQLIISICIWLQSASILTKAFTGLLLNTYFNIKFIPYAQTFQDIYQDQSFEVQGGFDREIDSLADNFDISKEIIDNIKDRSKSFSTKYNIKQGSVDIDNVVFNKMINGKLISILDTATTNLIKSRYQKWVHLLSVSDKRYYNFQYCLIIQKNAKLTKIITFLYVIF